MRIGGSKQVGYALRVTQISSSFSEKITGTGSSFCRVTASDTATYTGHRIDLPRPLYVHFDYSRDSNDAHTGLSWSHFTFVSTDDFASTSPDVYIAHCSWDYGDGSPAGAGCSNYGSYSHVFARSGTYVVTYTVITDEGVSGSMSRRVVVPTDTPPQPNFTWSHPIDNCGVDPYYHYYCIHFVDGSIDTDDDIVQSTIEFGDPGSGPWNLQSPFAYTFADYVYKSPGSYTVTLTETDEAGKSTTMSKTITVP